ncbi:MAG: type II secretion system protein [Candidatus Pacebacteria bacterium]|nr:type II secretion system protein [Candidatus Paceibacterota bacterium]
MRRHSQAGFTLIEMIVSVGLFGIVMMVSVTALVALVDANRKAQALQSVINNLNIAIDGMSRSIREGSNYRADGNCSGNTGGVNDCTGGGTIIYFEHFGGDPLDTADDWIYEFRDGRIFKSTTGSTADEVAITAAEVTIESVKFYVFGSTRGDSVQPKVMVVIKGSAGTTKANVKTTFHVQSTAVQRVIDI